MAVLARRQTRSDASSPAERANPAEAEPSDHHPRCGFGPLGIGVDVQAAVAFAQPHRPALHFDPQQLDELRQKNRGRYRRASRRLFHNPEARRCFWWSQGGNAEPTVARDETGLPRYRPQIKVWLEEATAGLCDIHNLPAGFPRTHRGDLSPDPDQWGVWAACDRSLRAWRDLERSARLEPYITQSAPIQPTYDFVPVLRSRGPDLVGLRSFGIPAFRPQVGHVFVVGNMPLLKLYCFAAAYQGDRHVPRGRLAGYFLETDDPIGKIAGELYARTVGVTPPMQVALRPRGESSRIRRSRRSSIASLISSRLILTGTGTGGELLKRFWRSFHSDYQKRS